MRISSIENEKAILNELGQRIKQHRISLNITQAELAEKCGISPSTETRIENGDDSKMSNYIKILFGLNLLDNLDILIPEVPPDFKLFYEHKTIRKRVKKKSKGTEPNWKWEEDK